MKDFRVQLLATDRGETIDEVVSFVAEDASGSFALMAGHARFMTVLVFGLARLRLADGRQRFVGLPGGVLYFCANELRLSTRYCLVGDDAAAIATALGRQMQTEAQALAQALRKLHRLEAQMLQHLVRVEAEGV